MIKHFERNTTGTDYAVGDIHGHFTLLQKALDAVGFDPKADRLFSVGDLVDRGPECRDVLEWLDKPWFHPVRGNHDDYVCRFDTCDIENWVYNGGAWFAGLAWDEQREFAAQFNDIPLAIEVETEKGLIGLVHADVPGNSWGQLPGFFANRNGRNYVMWSRSRFEHQDRSGVDGVRAVVCGHTPLRHPAVLGNVYHIDTAGWLPSKGGYFTLLNLATLEATPAIPKKLEW
jgi:serine/threonine protein phosphatase 1